jgi:hypothetical protein
VTILEAIDHVLSHARTDIYVDVSQDPDANDKSTRDLLDFFKALDQLKIVRDGWLIESDPVDVVEFVERNSGMLGGYKTLTIFRERVDKPNDKSGN